MLIQKTCLTLSYVLLVTGPPYGTQQASSAYQFAQACVASGHRLQQIFFYQAGVLNSNALLMPATDEFDLLSAWQRLAEQQGIALLVCSSAAARRGVLGQSTAVLQKGSEGNLATGFTVTGLTELAAAVLTCDRVLQF